MQLGNVIRKYRKEKNLTQEEMAVYLGVTAPAVNKWESGASCPDIALLSPIARLLGISTDTLLSFKEELTREEIGQIINGIAEKMQTEDFGEVFEEAMQIIREYPNCELLILTMAQILDSGRIIIEIENFEEYEDRIIVLFERALASRDMNVKHGAMIALFNKCLEKEEYEKAQNYLNQIEKQQTDPEKYQALLYVRQGKIEEAYKLYERFILTGGAELSMALNGLYRLAIAEKDFERAEWIVRKESELSEVLENGEYSKLAPWFCLAQDKRDKDAWFSAAWKLTDALKDVNGFKNSELYRHMKFYQDEAGTQLSRLTQILKKGFEMDKELDFLRDDPRFEKLMEKLSDL